MRLMIDIPEDVYDHACSRSEDSNDGYTAMRAIAKGIPLPKSHGRLKDIDAFISKVQADRQHAVYTRSWTADDVLNALTNSYAPTVIEADKAESEHIGDTE